MNSRPMAFVDYRCGHSTPVRGTGRAVDRDCPACTDARDCLSAPGSHPGPYCDFDMCQSRIP